MKDYGNEKVLVVRDEDIKKILKLEEKYSEMLGFASLPETGILSVGARWLYFCEKLIEHTFMLRNEAEYNFDYKQIIPYVVLYNHGHLFVTQRISGGDERLLSKFSLGQSGHINPIDSLFERFTDNLQDLIYASAFREVNEELHLPSNICSGNNRGIAGLIYDNSNEVSSVHLGVVILIDLTGEAFEDVSVKETEKAVGKWVSIAELYCEYYDRMETWSQLILDKMVVMQSYED